MSAKSTRKPSPTFKPLPVPGGGRADLARLRRVSDAEIARTAPPELANLPADFWVGAEVVEPVAKEPISLRVDVDVLAWFRAQGPRYQSRMNAVLRAYMQAKARPSARRAPKRAG